MKIAVGNISRVVADYFETVLMPSAMNAGGLRACTVGFVGGLVTRQTPQMVEQYVPIAKALGLIDDQNQLDVDMAYEEATKAMSRSPLVIADYRVDQTDLDKIREIARRYSV